MSPTLGCSISTTTCSFSKKYIIFSTYSPRSVDCAMFHGTILRVTVWPKPMKIWNKNWRKIEEKVEIFFEKRFFQKSSRSVFAPRLIDTHRITSFSALSDTRNTSAFSLKVGFFSLDFQTSKILNFVVFIGLGHTFTLKIVSWNIAQSTALGEYIIKIL